MRRRASGSDGPLAGTAEPRVRIFREVLYILAFYLLYSFVRNRFGSATVSPETAYANALTIIDLEKAMGIFNEATVQGWFLDASVFLRGVNIYYGTLHFVVPVGVLVFLALRHPAAYPFWRTTLLAGTGIALVGYALFPLMPPRLLCDCAYGAGPQVLQEGLPTFVDTLAVHGGLWSFDSGTMQVVSNQYAAMPSLHMGWALWCAMALWPFLRVWWARALAVAYPLFTLFTIVVTGNHFWLDAVGGVVVIAAGYWVARAVQAMMQNRRRGAGTVAGDAAAPPATIPPASPDASAAGRSTAQEAPAP
ncbi:phosphatase PAP2 family protein [Rhabdothermincola salaria]|uniref:phosphatase PAP2 family protein n=1 Tax=Rhabdothermincola salaria TaxID=2903142 RepID=UPI001E63BC70|nr:phosphatase PAP2 family protein [Rhabdothermincola salaria]MCD9623792.1 phosphatase PAP2 family protein [Rhabdothermincola salaria]